MKVLTLSSIWINNHKYLFIIFPLPDQFFIRAPENFGTARRCYLEWTVARSRGSSGTPWSGSVFFLWTGPIAWTFLNPVAGFPGLQTRSWWQASGPSAPRTGTSLPELAEACGWKTVGSPSSSPWAGWRPSSSSGCCWSLGDYRTCWRRCSESTRRTPLAYCFAVWIGWSSFRWSCKETCWSSLAVISSKSFPFD